MAMTPGDDGALRKADAALYAAKAAGRATSRVHEHAPTDGRARPSGGVVTRPSTVRLSQPVAPSGRGGACVRGLRLTGAVGRAHLERVARPARRPTRRPTAARCRWPSSAPSLRPAQSPPSTRPRPSRCRRCCAQATPATACGPARASANDVGHVDARLRLDRRLLGPPAVGPVRVKSANRVTSMSVTHLVADTYPYRPGTTMRAGKPWTIGSGSPFMPMASIASRPSVTAAIGVPAVNPSALVDSSASAPSWTPASSSSSASEHAEPGGVAGQVAAHLVGHARQRDPALDEPALQQVGEGRARSRCRPCRGCAAPRRRSARRAG